MLFHLPQLRSYVLSCYNQASETGHLKPVDLDFAINEAFMSRVVDLMNLHEGYFEETYNFALVSGQEGYNLPSNFTAGQKQAIRVAILERKISNAWVPCEFRRRYTEANPTDGAGVADAYVPSYKFRGRQIILEPTPVSDEDAANTRLTYVYMPPRLRSTNCAAGASTTGAEAQVRLDDGADPRDDYYVGARVHIVSGTCDAVGQTRTITDYDGNTKIATLDSAWTIRTVVANTNPKAVDIFSILIHDDFPEIFHELIALDACMSGYLRERAASLTISDFAKMRQLQLAKKFADLLENRTDQPKFTRPWHIEL